jgi:anti-anti-sigma factor
LGKHICWVFDTDESFRTAAEAFLDEGRRQNEQTLLVDDPAAVIQLHLPVGTFDGDRQRAMYTAMAEQALAAGYDGLRVVVNATPLAADPSVHPLVMTCELTVGEMISDLPITAVCAYDERVVGLAAADMACVHSTHLTPSADDPGFSLFMASGRLHITGEIDIHNTDRFNTALAAAAATPDASKDLVVDAGELDFIDVNGTAELVEFSRRLAGAGRLKVIDAPRSLRSVLAASSWDSALDLVTAGAQL